MIGGVSLDKRIVQVPNGIAKDGRPICARCQCRHFEVNHSFEWFNGAKRRRRSCRNCGWILRTKEVLDSDPEK